MKNKITLAAQLILGLLYFVPGLDGFLHFIKVQPEMPPAAMSFAGALFNSGYFFPFLKSIELTAGFLLLIGLYSPVALAVLAPITINIVLFHSMLTPGLNNLVMPLTMLGMHAIAVTRYWKLYRPLFKKRY